ncbi:MAG: universal stress protein [Armatimonadota bacterium]|nr:STAS domain-containing protein [bacterium]
MIIEAREDTITLRGSIKTNIWPAIQAAAALLLEHHPTGIIIDCSAVDKITAKGAETLADAFRYIQERNARIVVAALSPELLEIGKEVPGVRSQVSIAATVDEARASLELEEVTPERGKARLAAVVPMLGEWQSAVDHACRLAIGQSTEIHLVDLIKVPRALPIGTPLPERESAGQQRLETGKALVAAMGFKVFAHVERVRAKSTGLIDFVKQLEADYAVVSIDHVDANTPQIEESDAMSLAEAADFEVSLVKGATTGHEMHARYIIVPAVGSWSHALEHACKLGHKDGAAIKVVSLIVVPRTEAINAPRPDAEAAAADAAKESARIGKQYGAKVEHVVERVRDPIIGFMKMFDAGDIDLAVVGVMRETTGDYHIAHAIAESLLHELPCETVFLRTGE